MTAAPVQTASAGKPTIPVGACVALGMGAVAVTAVVLLSVYTPVIKVLFSPTPPAIEPLPDSSVRTREREFGTRIASAAEKVVKRSPFHPPIIPEPEAPRVPPFYAGPRIVGVAGGAVYFDDSKKIPVGATIDGIQVIKVDAPWSVTLGWRGGKYDVVMLDRNPVSFSDSPMIKDTLFRTTPAAAPEAPPTPAPQPAPVPQPDPAPQAPAQPPTPVPTQDPSPAQMGK